jgi:hypothetical protein
MNGERTAEIKQNRYDYTIYLYENHRLLQQVFVPDKEQAEQMVEAFVGLSKPTLLNESN